MKKYIVGFLLGVFLIPSVTLASVNPGVEFLSPLVQTIIQLLQDRISVLSAENEALRAQLAAQTTICVSGAVKSTETPQDRYNTLMKAEEVRIRSEFASRIAPIEAEIRELSQKIQDPMTHFECGGYGCPVRKFGIEAAEKRIRELTIQKQAIEVERAKQLAAVGVF